MASWRRQRACETTRGRCPPPPASTQTQQQNGDKIHCANVKLRKLNHVQGHHVVMPPFSPTSYCVKRVWHQGDEQQFSGTRERHSSQGQDMWCSSEQADSVDVNETWSRAQRDITPILGANITGSYLRSQSVFKTWGETTIIIFHPSTDMSNRVLHSEPNHRHLKHTLTRHRRNTISTHGPLPQPPNFSLFLSRAEMLALKKKKN